MRRCALITGISGQDGSYLAELLVGKGYEVHGVVRRSSNPGPTRLTTVRDKITLHDGDVTDQGSVTRIVFDTSPDEIYNLAAQSFVGTSWDQPVATADVTGLGAVRVYEAARQYRQASGKEVRVYQASTSELFGNSPAPQSEITRFAPRSPYGSAKLYAHETARVYRESFGMFVACGILFNHESERRGTEFVTRKITRQIAEIVTDQRKQIVLGNMDVRRDWGYAPDYVEAMWLMLQHGEPLDLVIGTGVSHSLKEFRDLACGFAGIREPWTITCEDGRSHRPAEVFDLRADPSRAFEELGWRPRTSFEDWVARMVKFDIKETIREVRESRKTPPE